MVHLFRCVRVTMMFARVWTVVSPRRFGSQKRVCSASALRCLHTTTTRRPTSQQQHTIDDAEAYTTQDIVYRCRDRTTHARTVRTVRLWPLRNHCEHTASSSIARRPTTHRTRHRHAIISRLNAANDRAHESTGPYTQTTCRMTLTVPAPSPARSVLHRLPRVVVPLVCDVDCPSRPRRCGFGPDRLVSSRLG
jgi:hypothetical protein